MHSGGKNQGEIMKEMKRIEGKDQGNQPQSEVVRLKELMDEICAGANEDYHDEIFESFSRRFKAAAWAWDPVTKPMPNDQIDRLGEVIMGPIYTCAEYDWPHKDGYPMAPLIQLDLAKASQTGGVNLGEGFIQIWMPHKAISAKDQHIRVVPKEFVDATKLTPVVDLPDDLDPLQVRDEEWDAETDDFVPSPAYQIIGYAPKRFTVDLMSIKDNHTIKDITSNPDLLGKIKEFDKLLKDANKKGPKSIRASNCHLFGTFCVIQYMADEKPLPLFCFESDEFGLMWGDGGNAQLFYKLSADGEPTFSFEWSCT